MSLHHRILSWSYQPIRLARGVARSLGLGSPDRLRVLLYHDVAPYLHERFTEQLRWLARRWTFVTPDRFADMIAGEERIRGRNLLLTFDDGFASNRIVAERILSPMGVRALFFIISEFAALEDREQAWEFIAERIQPGINLHSIPPHLYNMGWADLSALLEMGHSIGGHTRTHARLSQISSEANLEREIIESADTLARELGIAVEHFAYAFGDVSSFSARALAVARNRFRCVYSGLRGDNGVATSALALRRDPATAEDSISLLGAFLEGAADCRYAKSRVQLDQWASRNA